MMEIMEPIDGKIIRIYLPHGRMCIDMENFLPATKKDTLKLLKVIRSDWENNESYDKIMELMREVLNEKRAAAKAEANRIVNYNSECKNKKQRIPKCELQKAVTHYYKCEKNLEVLDEVGGL